MKQTTGRRWKAILIGTVLALVPAVCLNLLLWFHMRGHSDANLRDAANGLMRLSEAYLDNAMAQLAALGMNAKPVCNPENLERVRRALLKAPSISEVAIDEKSGTECAVGGLRRVPRAISSENDTSVPHVKMTVVELGSWVAPRSIRLVWRFDEGGSFSILLPGERLLPPIVIGRMQADFTARVSLIDGTFIAQRSTRPEEESATGSTAQDLRLLSDRHPISLQLSVANRAIWKSYEDLFVYGNIGAFVLMIFTITGSVIVARQMEGPEREITDALKRGEFIPYYQPVIDLRDGSLRGCEVLVRRRRANGKIESPFTFLPIAERTGQIFDITRALMIKARDEVGEVYGDRPHLKISFNLVADHFKDVKVVDEIRSIFDKSPLKPRQLVFEVTERQPLQDLATARQIITRLQEYGARVSLDDVGTGHSGLSYLLKLGVDQMKMDKMFVDAIGTDRYSGAIIETLIKLAEDLSIELVAEGVETVEQVNHLRARGVTCAQGYVFAPPLPGSSYLALCKAMTPRAAGAGAVEDVEEEPLELALDQRVDADTPRAA